MQKWYRLFNGMALCECKKVIDWIFPADMINDLKNYVFMDRCKMFNMSV